jgi:hypothetical protein
MAQPEKLRKLFPHGSKTFFELNPGLSHSEPESGSLFPLDSLPKGKKPRHAPALLVITSYRCNRLDDDNLRGGAKGIIDCIKELGLISGDDPSAITLSVVQKKVNHRWQEKTLVEITYK